MLCHEITTSRGMFLKLILRKLLYAFLDVGECGEQIIKWLLNASIIMHVKERTSVSRTCCESPKKVVLVTCNGACADSLYQALF